MILFLGVALVLAAVLLVKPPLGASARFRRACRRSAPKASRTPSARWTAPTSRPLSSRTGRFFPWPGLFQRMPFLRRAASLSGRWLAPGRKRGRGKDANQAAAGLTLVVQQLAALLKGGRSPARLWDEIWLLYAGPGSHAHRLSPESAGLLASVRAAAARGTPVSDTIRRAAATAFPRRDREHRIWSNLAACFDIAEASGCPLADVLARFAAQLDVEDDADAARQTALAGPKATVSLLTWLPLMGLGLGMALGVDPLAMLLGTPWGLAALAAGIGLTVAGRVWSARLVATAAGAGMP